MKALSLSIIVLILCLKAVFAQDTTARSKPAHPKFSVKSIFHEMTISPQQAAIEHRHRDSVLRAASPPEHHHPTLYIDGGFGYAFLGTHGIQGNYSLNYQYERSLFTFRGITIASYRNVESPQPYEFIIFPDYRESNGLVQRAFLYGWRFTNSDQHALSYSMGISFNDKDFYYYNAAKQRSYIQTTYAGLPFEANYQVYTRRFGVSFGLKLAGDISRYSFVSFGVDMGLGFHYTK